MTDWTPCDTPPPTCVSVWLTTCRYSSAGHRRVHRGASFDGVSWWSNLHSRIQDIPISWKYDEEPKPDYQTKPNLEARQAEVEKSCAIMRGELNIGEQ